MVNVNRIERYKLLLMSNRKRFFGGNWKCNNTLAQTQGLVSSLLDQLEFNPEEVGTNFLTQMWS